jgi:hypothetical protein
MAGILTTSNGNILTDSSNRILVQDATPLDLPNLKLYLSASRMPQYADGTAISSFLDYSSNNYHATQATGSLQPLFKTNQFGANAGIKGDSIDDYLSITGGALNIFRNIDQYTVQILCKRSTTSSSGYPFIVYDNAGTEFRLIILFSSGGAFLIGGKQLDSDTRQNISITSNDLNTHFIQATLNPSNNTIYAYFDGIFIGSVVVSSGLSTNTGSNKVQLFQTSSNASAIIVNGISVNTSYSDYSTIQAQYRGYLSRGYL